MTLLVNMLIPHIQELSQSQSCFFWYIKLDYFYFTKICQRNTLTSFSTSLLLFGTKYIPFCLHLQEYVRTYYYQRENPFPRKQSQQSPSNYTCYFQQSNKCCHLAGTVNCTEYITRVVRLRQQFIMLRIKLESVRN